MPFGTWITSDTAIVSITATSIYTMHGIGLAGGTATITYIAPGSSCKVTEQVTVNPVPLIYGIAPCFGDTASLIAIPAGGKWFSDNPGRVSVDSLTGMAAGLAYGEATLTYVMPSGCSVTKLANVPLPIAGLPPLVAELHFILQILLRAGGGIVVTPRLPLSTSGQGW